MMVYAWLLHMKGIKGRMNLMSHVQCPSSLLKFSRVKYGRLFPVACLNLCFARCSSFPDTGSQTKKWTWVIVRNCQLGAFLNRYLKKQNVKTQEMQKRQTTSCNQELGIDVNVTKSVEWNFYYYLRQPLDRELPIFSFSYICRDMMTLSIHVYIALSACHTQSAFLSDTQLKTSSQEREIKNKTKQSFQDISSDTQLSVLP